MEKEESGRGGWQVMAAAAIALLLLVFGAIGGPFGAIYFAASVLLAILGLLLILLRNQAAAITGQALLSLAGGAVLYPLAIALAFLLFYNLQPYDEPTTGFRAWFWATYAASVVLTLAISAGVARRFQKPIAVTTVAIGAFVIAAALPTLWLIAFISSCGGIGYPFDLSCG